MDKKYGVGVKRVSTNRQYQEGDSPEDQHEQIQRTANSQEPQIIIKKWFDFHQSAAGEIQPSQQAIDYCKDPRNKISYLLVKNIERFTRGGAGPYTQLKAQLVRYGVTLLDCYGVVGKVRLNTLDHLGIKYDWSDYSPTNTSEILEAERAHNDRRDILTKLIGSQIRYTQLGFHINTNVMGFTFVKRDTEHGRRYVPEPHPEEAHWFTKMFELRVQGNLTDEQIVTQINLLGFKTRIRYIHDHNNRMKIIGQKGGGPLTVKQMQRYITRPMYAGVVCEKWTHNQPIRGVFEGLVSIDLFNKANRGAVAILDEGGILKIVHNIRDQWRLKKLRENPDYPYKRQVLCPICRRPVLGSASKSKSGRHISRYHCSRGHKYWSVNLKIFNETIEMFVKRVRFSDDFIEKFTRIFLEEWQKRERNLFDDSITINKRVVRIDQEIIHLKYKIKVLNSESTIRMIEDDIDKLLLEKANLIQNRDKKEEEQIDVQLLINHCKYFMEHLENLLLQGPDPLKNATLFGLIFAKTPTYDELVNGTPQLSRLFKLNEAYKSSKFLSVGAQGFEP